MMAKVLVIAPHPDDETLGAGGTLLRHIASGDEVYWCVVTHAFADSTDAYRKERLLMIEKVSRAYGFVKHFLLNFPAAALDTVPIQRLIDALSNVIQEVRPEIVYSVGDSDVNTDHDVVYRAVMVATKPVYVSFIKEILLYEIPSSTNWSFPQKGSKFQPNVFVDITSFIKRKLDLLMEFGYEIKKAPHPRSLDITREWNIVRGSTIMVMFAEAFMLARKIVK